MLKVLYFFFFFFFPRCSSFTRCNQEYLSLRGQVRFLRVVCIMKLRHSSVHWQHDHGPPHSLENFHPWKDQSLCVLQ